MGTSGNKPNTKKQNDPNSPPDADQLECKIDQYLCTMCKNVPELTNVFTDNGYVEFKCKEHGTIILTVQQYFEKLKESEFIYYNFKCIRCNKKQKDHIKDLGLFKYCYNCKQIFCKECYPKHINENTKCKINECIQVNEMNTRCLEHFDEGIYTSFCLDDHENVCEYKNNGIEKHKKHNIKSFFNIVDSEEKLISKKNQVLKNLIKFNELILNTYKKYPDNYFHIINVKNLARLINAENSRDPKELETLFKELELNLKIKKKAIDEIRKKLNISLKGNEESLILRNKGIDDNALKLLSKVKLINLKELDLSYNKIKNIEYLENSFMGNLEYLSLNNNQIEDISVFEDMDFNKLKELNLQNNYIKKVVPLLEASMPALELLRIEGNSDLEPTMNEMKKLINKYQKKIVCVIQTFEDFNKKYEINFQKTSKRLDLNGNTNGNDILKDLYLLLPEINELTELRLADCGIDNISTLSRINLPKVERIDLSFNKIINIEPLCNMRKNQLKILYLNNNFICDILPLKKIKFFGGKGNITIEKNNIIVGKEVEGILKELQDNNIQVKI